jgi:hypothetical protein
MSDIGKSLNSSGWNSEINKILDNIRLNSIILEEYHKNNYFKYRKIVIYIKVPVIVLSALNSIVSVSMQEFLSQNYVSLINCGMSFSVGIISSISLLLKLEDNTESEHSASRNYHKLSSDISKILALREDDRGCDADVFLNQKYNEYISYYDKSNILDLKIKDNLREVVFFGISESSQKLEI